MRKLSTAIALASIFTLTFCETSYGFGRLLGRNRQPQVVNQINVAPANSYSYSAQVQQIQKVQQVKVQQVKQIQQVQQVQQVNKYDVQRVLVQPVQAVQYSYAQVAVQPVKAYVPVQVRQQAYYSSNYCAPVQSLSSGYSSSYSLGYSQSLSNGCAQQSSQIQELQQQVFQLQQAEKLRLQQQAEQLRVPPMQVPPK